MSAAFGSFILGISALLLSDISDLGRLIIFTAMLLIFAALCIIAIIVLLLTDFRVKGKKTTRPTLIRSGMLVGPPSGSEQRGELRKRNKEFEPAAIEFQPLPEPTPINYQSVGRVPTTNQQEKSHSSKESPSPIITPPSTPPPVSIDVPLQSRSLNILPMNSSGWRPLFEEDELYELPHTGSQFFIRTKSNDILENCEDSCAISNDEICYALCDGVSTSTFARPWARLLAVQWIKHPLKSSSAEDINEWLAEPRKLLQDWINETWLVKINDRNRSMGRIEFTTLDAKKLIAQGAATTFLGVTLDRTTASWSAIIVGDTCLFHFFLNPDDTWNYKGYPFKAANEFSDIPSSITSRPDTAAIVGSNMLAYENKYKPGEMLIMATDALAEWFYMMLELKQLPHIIDLIKIMNNENFSKFVDQERSQKQMKDDDTSLVIIHL